MLLTRAQIVTMYGKVMNMPIDVEIDILTVDDYGHTIAEARSESTGAEVRFRFLKQGGADVLGAAKPVG